MKPTLYSNEVATRYTVYNSLFLDLPFSHIYRTGTLLPILGQISKEGFEAGKTPSAIVEQFQKEVLSTNSSEELHKTLFRFVQYIERQVLLFDSIEDAAFEKIYDTQGKGSIKELISNVRHLNKMEVLKAKLADFRVRVVLTAHPTQFYPGNVLGINSDLEGAIRDGDLGMINQLMQQLGKTPFINREKPSPYEEAVSLCWYLENVFYKAIPRILYPMIEELGESWEEWINPELLSVGFWPGGDRDGNPFVTHDTTRKVAARLRETVLKCYYRDIRAIKRRMTFKGVEDKLILAERKLYNALYGDQTSGFYQPEELIEILKSALEILRRDHYGMFADLLEKFILKVRVFGFHFAALDIRQDSRKHAALWEDLILEQHGQKALEKYQKADELSKIDFILKQEEITASPKEDFHEEMLKTFDALQDVKSKNGHRSCHRYIISNCQSVLHIMQVWKLARLNMSRSNYDELDIVPLFETIDDLAEAPAIMERLYQMEGYKEHLAGRENKQTIMVGFSDGTKDGGYMRANWSIFRAKEALTEVSRKYGIKVIFFDGRGGPPARGGGNMHDFYASLGTGIEDQEIQVTIQGQTISANYGKVSTCKYNLEQLLSAGLENAIFANEERQLKAEERTLIEELAEIGYEQYKAFKSHPQFTRYLAEVTPLKYFGETNIGSRPTSRGKGGELKFEDLRAIPFVGAWSQMKQNIPGFFGLGSALEVLKSKGKADALKELYRNSLFFRTLLGNSMQSIAKAYYPATAYLGNDAEYGEFWHLMNDEFNLSRKNLNWVSGEKGLMHEAPVSKESIAIRERIVLPLITIQQYAIEQLRAGKNDEVYQRLILRCMFGIVNAARNAA
ncbi:MAG: phosphoenolpyruvate carboxylase [Cyclobacteriaceae bacterium]|nr:phosphoenolpyruvate carboxylase [Cyclobacteriaceae bacterium]MCH8516130.1 phosphoenolpyruvate carboxylase [Cyclobacteriaceae bacterium]